MALWILLCQVASASSDPRFSAAEIELRIALDGSMLVRETLTVRAQAPHPPPFRDLPWRMLAHPPTPEMAIEVLQVRQDDRPLPWRTEASTHHLRVHFGVDGQTQPAGERIYELLYHVDGQLALSGDRESLLWLPLGPGLAHPVREPRISVAFARPLPGDGLQVNVTPLPTPAGNVVPGQQVDRDGTVHIHWPALVPAGQRVAFLVSWPAGHLRPGADSDREPWLRPSSNPLWWGLAGLPLIAIAAVGAGCLPCRYRRFASLSVVAVFALALLYWVGASTAMNIARFQAGFAAAMIATLWIWITRHRVWRPGWRLISLAPAPVLMLAAVAPLVEAVSVFYPLLWLAYADLFVLALLLGSARRSAQRGAIEIAINPPRVVCKTP